MADYWVYSGSAQDDSDATWNSSTLAYLDLDTCLAAVAAGSNVWVAHDHSKTYSADTTINNNGTVAAPIVVICVNRTTGAITTGAIEETTGSTYSLRVFEDNVIYNGVSFKSGDLVSVDGDSTVTLINSTFEFVTNSADILTINVADKKVIWKNVLYKVANAGSYIRTGASLDFTWEGGGVDSGGTAIAVLLKANLTYGTRLKFIGLDLSHITSSVLELSTVISSGVHHAVFSGCKLPSAVPILDSSSLTSPHKIDAYSCDNGDTKDYFESTRLEGQTKYATNCFRTNSSVEYSAKMTSNANALNHTRPLKFKLCDVYAAANPTLTVEMIGTVELEDDECWLEIEYPNETDEALRDIDDSSRVTTGWSGGSGHEAPQAAAVLDTSTEGWTEDLASELKRKIAVTIVNGAAGIHTVYVCVAYDLSAPTPLYVDPDVTVS